MFEGRDGENVDRRHKRVEASFASFQGKSIESGKTATGGQSGRASFFVLPSVPRGYGNA